MTLQGKIVRHIDCRVIPMACAFAFVLAISLPGCRPRTADIPPYESRVTLSNIRIEKELGDDVLKVDYEFVTGLPDRGYQYQMQATWPNGDTSETTHYMNETQVTGTLEGVLMTLPVSGNEGVINLKVRMRILNNDAGMYQNISNDLQIDYDIN